MGAVVDAAQAPYDGPIVRNQPAQEVMMDFVFTSLGIDGAFHLLQTTVGVRFHLPLAFRQPIVSPTRSIITEPFANTLFSRSR